ncbi:MAG: TrkA family potassium uptake protein [Rubrobacter sp.]|nr:TrkA family potassium uptake protein [Rubrobacter sp.]MDQ3637686.1 TrkA family potassium uptake protein [Actinomycetota bacterium]
MSKQFAVIGMGRVGASLVRTLDSLGHDVLGIDCDGDRIQDLSDELPGASLVAADATEDSVLRDLGLDRFDGAAVVIGESIQSSVLVTLILKDLGVPMIFSRANNDLHGRVLERVGADHVIQPEKEFGEFLARQMSLPGIQDYLELGQDEALIEIEAPQSWIGKSLADLQLHRKKDLTVLAIKGREKGGTLPKPDTPLQEGDILVVGGQKVELDKLDPADV